MKHTTLISLAAAVLASAILARPSAAQSGKPADSTRTAAQWKAFVFDKEFRSTSGLEFGFSRPTRTVGPDSVYMAPDQPRYANVSAIAPAPTVEVIRQTTGYTVLLASGLDHDGTTPILVTYEDRSSLRYLDVFAVGSEGMLHAEQTGVGRTRTVVGASGDLLGGTRPGRRYILTAGVVCHGLIVLFSTVEIFDAASQKWLEAADAFVVSQDRGQSWSLAYESAPFAPGNLRGNSWSMQNWWPTERGVAPREAYFTATDYCFNPGSPGGRFYIMRARRTAPGEPWTIDPGAVAMHAQGANQHIHTGGVIPFGDGGIRVFFSIGDGRNNSRVVSLINTVGDYISGDWIENQTYHGSAGVPGTDANLFIGCAPGPSANTALVGADLSSEQIMLLTLDEKAPHPRTDRLYGFPCADGDGFTVFVIRTPTPELGGPYVANAEPWEPTVLPYSRRAVYSPDGVRWAQAIAPDGGGAYPILHDGDIYFCIANSHGFGRTPAPRLTEARPLLVGPGGVQRAAANPVLNPGSQTRITPLSRDSLGRWVDDGVPLDPQPPTMGAVYRVRTTATDPVVLGRIYPCGVTQPLGRSISGDVQLRVWAHQADPSRTGSLAIGVGNGTQTPTANRSWIISSTNAWFPVDVSPQRFPADGVLALTVRCLGATCADQTMYIALDNAVVGPALSAYPMMPDETLPPVGTMHPDERAWISGIACQKAWTISLALQVPEDGFDYRTPGQSIWPLGTIWADNDNYLEFFADTARGQMWATLTVRGVTWSTIVSDATVLERGAPILLSVAQPLDRSRGIEITASVGGRDARSITIPDRLTVASRLYTPPREIRFWSHASAMTAQASAVSPLLVWGGRIDENRALSRTEREHLLNTLSFLGPLPPW